MTTPHENAAPLEAANPAGGAGVGTTEAHEPQAAQTRQQSSYRSILKSSSLIGGASILNILIGMVRTKFVALLLGPGGVGLMGMYNQITALVTAVSGMGLSNSGVRQVAEAVGTGDEVRVARTVKTLRRTVWVTGGLGAAVMAACSVPISRISFDSGRYAGSIALLGVVILLTAITSGQACVLQGTRRIADLAKISVTGAVSGTAISIPFFYLWGNDGIVPSLVLCAAAALATSWWYARRVPVAEIVMPWQESRAEARRLLAVGAGFMGAGLVMMLSTYLIRVLLLRRFGLGDVGIYQAAFALSGIFVNFVLGAMGTDYYPRLTAGAGDDGKVARMVNEQAEISMLLAMPGLAAMIVFAPLIVRLFYSASFAAAVPILRWCTLGVVGQIFSWPLGYVILAKGKSRLFFLTETLAVAVHVGGIYLFTSLFGLTGAGIAFTAFYVFHFFMILAVVRRLVGATFTRRNVVLICCFTAVMALLMVNCCLNPSVVANWGVSLAVLAAVTWFCLRRLSRSSGVGVERIVAKFTGRKGQSAS